MASINPQKRSKRNKYVGSPHCRAEMYAGRVACCPLVSCLEYVRAAVIKRDRRMTRLRSEKKLISVTWKAED